MTREELVKLHRNLSHPATENLYNLLKLARPWETDNETRKVLEERTQNCDYCQHFPTTPIRFKVTLPTEEEIIFGDELSIDLMFLDGIAVLHIIYTAARFSAVTFLDAHTENYGQSVYGIWFAFVQ